MRKAIEEYNRKKSMKNCNCNCQVDTTHLVILLDRSGSMSQMRDGAIEGFNSYIQSQASLPGVCKVTLIQFDDRYEPVYQGTNIKFVAPLTRENFVPRGGTALFDALGKSINSINLVDTDRTIFVVISDGEENSSREYTKETIQILINNMKVRGVEFAFVGTNMDAIMAGTSLGVMKQACLNYIPSNEGMVQAYGAISRSTSNYRVGTSQCMDFSNESQSPQSY